MSSHSYICELMKYLISNIIPANDPLTLMSIPYIEGKECEQKRDATQVQITEISRLFFLPLFFSLLTVKSPFPTTQLPPHFTGNSGLETHKTSKIERKRNNIYKKALWHASFSDPLDRDTYSDCTIFWEWRGWWGGYLEKLLQFRETPFRIDEKR